MSSSALKPGRIYFKDASVKVAGVHPELFTALAKVATFYGDKGFPLIVTSMNDGTHKIGSLHYEGRAADVRTKLLPPGGAEIMRAEVAGALGPRFDVVLEDLAGPNEHLHLEADRINGGL